MLSFSSYHVSLNFRFSSSSSPLPIKHCWILLCRIAGRLSVQTRGTHKPGAQTKIHVSARLQCIRVWDLEERRTCFHFKRRTEGNRASDRPSSFRLQSWDWWNASVVIWGWHALPLYQVFHNFLPNFNHFFLKSSLQSDSFNRRAVLIRKRGNYWFWSFKECNTLVFSVFKTQ